MPNHSIAGYRTFFDELPPYIIIFILGTLFAITFVVILWVNLSLYIRTLWWNRYELNNTGYLGISFCVANGVVFVQYSLLLAYKSTNFKPLLPHHHHHPPFGFVLLKHMQKDCFEKSRHLQSKPPLSICKIYKYQPCFFKFSYSSTF